MARPSKIEAWRPTEKLRIRSWFEALLHAVLPADAKRNSKGELRSSELQNCLADKDIEVTSGRLTEWRKGCCLPSKGKLIAISQKFSSAASCEAVLHPCTSVSEDRIANLFVVLDAFAAKEEMRLRCIDLIHDIARPWLPEAIVKTGAAYGWRVDKLGIVPPEIAHSVNPLDPISMLQGCLLIGDYVLATHATHDTTQDQDKKKTAALYAHWAFDTLCVCLLVTRLIARELSRGDGDRVHPASGSAVVVRKVLLGETKFKRKDHLAAKLRLVEAPSSNDFVNFLFMCQELVAAGLQERHIHVKSMLDMVNNRT